MERRNYTFLLSLVGFVLLVSSCTTDTSEHANSTALPEVVDFNFHVKPILSDRCFKCHGPDPNTREADLRLDTREGALAVLKEDSTRYTIVPGDASNSEVFIRIVHPDPEQRMPHPDSKLFLSDHEKALIERWINQGAEWKDHWAFMPPVKSALPGVKQTSWPRNELDYFVLARLEYEGLQPAKEEKKEKWLRRVYFDITGLPPSEEEIDAFLADESEEAYEKVVDHLLANPAYGERMASIWLDIARYSDSHGYQDDRPRTMWPWRDWVIRAYNDNLPYDQFISWQIAGDLLPDASYEQKLATAFNRNHAITQEGGVINEEYVTEYVADRTNTMSTAFMGITMECARCHDHKYDPVSQKDYFQLFAFFNGINERGQINYFDLAPMPHMRVQDPALEARIEKLNQLTEEASQIYAGTLEDASGASFASWQSTDLQSIDWEARLDEGLVAHFSLDTLVAGETDNLATKGHIGRINTRLLNELAAPDVIRGRNGNAFAFDGENYLNIGDRADFDHAQRFSMGAWINHPGTNKKQAGIIVKRNEEQKRGGYQLILTEDQTLRASLIHNQGSERIEVETRSKVPASVWQHAFITYNGSGKAEGLNIFLDGEKQPTTIVHDSLARRSILNGNDVLIGNWTTRNTRSSQISGFEGGGVDEVRIYDRELAPVEVEVLAGVEPDLEDPNKVYPLYLHSANAAFMEARDRLDSLRSIQLEIPMIMIMDEMEEPRTTHVLARGAYDAPMEAVGPGTPEAILAFPEDLPRNRLGLAQWLVHPDHPLTSRVAVNRLWQMFFGDGIVRTPEDFGSQGALPSHPELLDWFAVWFRESGWDTKAAIKYITLSSTYRQSATILPESLSKRPGQPIARPWTVPAVYR